MKKITLLLLFIGFSTAAVMANPANNYMVDDYAVDQLFETSTEVEFNAGTANMFGAADVSFGPHDKDVTVAFLLSWFTGPLGIHRLYLGTSTITFVAYLLTAGGCGIAALGDWIVLLVELAGDKNIDRFVDNPSFFMWLN